MTLRIAVPVARHPRIYVRRNVLGVGGGAPPLIIDHVSSLGLIGLAAWILWVAWLVAYGITLITHTVGVEALTLAVGHVRKRPSPRGPGLPVELTLHNPNSFVAVGPQLKIEPVKPRRITSVRCSSEHLNHKDVDFPLALEHQVGG